MKINNTSSPLRHSLAAALISAGLIMALPLAAHAAGDADRIQDLERKLERSMRLIEDLSAKVQKLEGKKDEGKVVGTDSKQIERMDTLERQVTQISAASGQSKVDGVPLHGFADVGYNLSNRGNIQGSGPKGFGVGSFDLYLNPQLGDRIKTLVELIFEVDEAGHVATDLERAQMGYTFSDAATAWVGRFHTPYGYWNTGLHHGAQIQTSILRPMFLDFEDKGGILPAHTVGAWLTGNVRAGEGKVSYDLYAGNGPRLESNVLNPNSARDDNHQAMVGFNLGYNFSGAAEGLKLGLHGFKTEVSDDVGGSKTDVHMTGVYGTYITDEWELLSEYYHFNNYDTLGGGDKHGSNAWFAQLGRNFGVWTPYGRYEKTSLNQNDPYFFNQVSGISYTRTALGLRYDLTPTSALKAELNRTRMNGTNFNGLIDDSFSEARLQWAVRF